MELLASIDLETFKRLAWIIAIMVALAWFGILWKFLKIPRRYWEIVGAIMQALLVGASTFFLVNLGMAIYILSHLTDPRWSAGKDPLLSLGDIQVGFPFEEIARHINDIKRGVTGAVNTAANLDDAFIAASYFFVSAVSAIIPVILLALLALGWGIWMKRRAEKQLEYDNEYRDQRLTNLEANAEIDPPVRKR